MNRAVCPCSILQHLNLFALRIGRPQLAFALASARHRKCKDAAAECPLAPKSERSQGSFKSKRGDDLGHSLQRLSGSDPHRDDGRKLGNDNAASHWLKLIVK